MVYMSENEVVKLLVCRLSKHQDRVDVDTFTSTIGDSEPRNDGTRCEGQEQCEGVDD